LDAIQPDLSPNPSPRRIPLANKGYHPSLWGEIYEEEDINSRVIHIFWA
jgi:hypothetical protein